MTFFQIFRRHRIVVNTDRYGRCYDGCNFSEELRWTAWSEIDMPIPSERLEARLKFWRDLNAYAVSQRGHSAKSEYKAEAIP